MQERSTLVGCALEGASMDTDQIPGLHAGYRPPARGHWEGHQWHFQSIVYFFYYCTLFLFYLFIYLHIVYIIYFILLLLFNLADLFSTS
jgi:hypothetical protein